MCIYVLEWHCKYALVSVVFFMLNWVRLVHRKNWAFPSRFINSPESWAVSSLYLHDVHTPFVLSLNVFARIYLAPSVSLDCCNIQNRKAYWCLMIYIFECILHAFWIFFIWFSKESVWNRSRMLQQKLSIYTLILLKLNDCLDLTFFKCASYFKM